MTDLEITKLCAKAMGLTESIRQGLEPYFYVNEDVSQWVFCGQDRISTLWKSYRYDPLHDDAQAMALVKKFELRIDRNFEDGGEGLVWTVTHHLCMKYGGISSFDNRNLNRAICECVAKMQAAAR